MRGRRDGRRARWGRRFAVAVTALALGGWAAGAGAAAKGKAGGGKGEKMDRMTARAALWGMGAGYLEAEAAIAAAGPRLHPMIREEAAKGGPLEAAVAEVLVGWADEGAAWRECLDKVAALEAKHARTAAGYPAELVLAAMLEKECKRSAARLLAVRVLKEGDDWERGEKLVGMLQYLKKVDERTAVEPLLRYLVVTRHETNRRAVAESLRAIGGAPVQARVEVELARIEAVAAALRRAAGPKGP